jgi:hypothetical protein
MKIKSVFIVLFSIGFLRAEVPDPLTLDFCQEQARINYPLTKQSELLKQAAEQKIRNLTTNRLPQLMINGQAAWQSDVTKISINLPNVSIPTIDKDSYKHTWIFRKQSMMAEPSAAKKLPSAALSRLTKRILKLNYLNYANASTRSFSLDCNYRKIKNY